jgi:hypothetical protein
MKPRAKANIKLVILFLILWVVKFLRTMFFILFDSKNNNVWVRIISKNLYRLKESRVRPKSIPNKIKKKIFKIREKFRVKRDKGRK